MKSIICIFLASILCVGCNNAQQRRIKQPNKKILRTASKSDPYSLDPRVACDRRAQSFLRLMYEGLVRPSSDGTPQLALAKSVEISPDGKAYTFTLKDTLWSNGDPLTAHDFEYTWKSLLSSDFPSNYSYAFYDIVGAFEAKEGKIPPSEVGVTALSDTVLRVELNNPCPYFLELLANPVFYPINKKHEQNNPDWVKNNNIISNGPFKLQKWKFKRSILLERNTQYWNAEIIQIDKIDFAIVPDEYTSLLLFENDQLDWVGDPFTNLPYEVIPDFKQRNILGISPSATSFWYIFNVDIYPVTHPKLRKALAYAINRESIVRHILQAYEEPSFSILPTTMALRKKPLFEDHDVKQARILFKEALEELGLTKEELPTLTISGTNKHLLLTQAIKEQWREAFGIDVKLESLEWNVYLTKLYQRDFQIGCYGWESWFNDPIYNLSSQKHKTDKINSTGWENADYISLLNDSKQVYDQSLRQAYLKKAEEILMDEMPIIPIYYTNRLYLKKDHLKGNYFTPLGTPEFMYCDLPTNKERE